MGRYQKEGGQTLLQGRRAGISPHKPEEQRKAPERLQNAPALFYWMAGRLFHQFAHGIGVGQGILHRHTLDEQGLIIEQVGVFLQLLLIAGGLGSL